MKKPAISADPTPSTAHRSAKLLLSQLSPVIECASHAKRISATASLTDRHLLVLLGGLDKFSEAFSRSPA